MSAIIGEPGANTIATIGEKSPTIAEPNPALESSQTQSELADYWKVAGVVLGNLVEWYDWAIFGLCANEIGQNFFPDENVSTASLKAFGVFSSAFIMRPFGAMLFGYIGDKYGRVVSLRYSILLMGASTLVLGCLPNYAQVGYMAPIALLIARLAQGLSVGGEGVTSAVFLYEEAPEDQRIWYMFVCSLAACGSFVANMVMFILHTSLTEVEMMNYGWRIPFMISTLLLALCMYLRQDLHEPDSFEEGEQVENPIAHAFTHQWRSILAIIFVKFDTFYYVLYTWIPEYFIGIHTPHIMEANLTVLFARIFVMGCSAIIGFYGDRWDNYVTMISCTIIKLFVCIPIFYFSLGGVTTWMELLLIMLPLAIVDGFIWVVKHVWVFTLIPNAKTRNTTLGIAHNVTAILSGLNPTLCAAFINRGMPVGFIGIMDFSYSIVVLVTLVALYLYKDWLLNPAKNINYKQTKPGKISTAPTPFQKTD